MTRCVFFVHHYLEPDLVRIFFGVGINVQGTVLVTVFVFGIKSDLDHTFLSGSNGFFRELEFGAAAQYPDLGDHEWLVAGIGEFVLEFKDHSGFGLGQFNGILYKRKLRLADGQSGVQT